MPMPPATFNVGQKVRTDDGLGIIIDRYYEKGEGWFYEVEIISKTIIEATDDELTRRNSDLLALNTD